MLIKLFEKYPIIAVDEARILGKVNGAILHDNRLVAILSSYESENIFNKYIQIPIENLIIGPEAFIVEKSSVANIHFPHGQAIHNQMSIYTPVGEFLGRITGIEISTDYTLEGIHIESGYIASRRIMNIGDVIIVDSDSFKQDFTTHSENDVVFLEIIHEENAEDTKNEMVFEESKDHPRIEETIDIKSDSPFSIEDSYEEPNDPELETIYSKYTYLLDKKLINPITVADKIYPADIIINTALIGEAIDNNCILSLIMNAED